MIAARRVVIEVLDFVFDGFQLRGTFCNGALQRGLRALAVLDQPALGKNARGQEYHANHKHQHQSISGQNPPQLAVSCGEYAGGRLFEHDPPSVFCRRLIGDHAPLVFHGIEHDIDAPATGQYAPDCGHAGIIDEIPLGGKLRVRGKLPPLIDHVNQSSGAHLDIRGPLKESVQPYLQYQDAQDFAFGGLNGNGHDKYVHPGRSSAPENL